MRGMGSGVRWGGCGIELCSVMGRVGMGMKVVLLELNSFLLKLGYSLECRRNALRSDVARFMSPLK